MTDRAQRYLEFYKKQRLEDQWTFYEDRRKEFEAARDEVVNLTVLFMVLTAVAAALAAANIAGLQTLWSILAVVFPALSTGLSAYNGLYAFERQAKLYGDAANALFRATADSPDLKPAMEATAFAAAVSAHVQQVEQILSGEQAQWGQLIGEIKPVEPPPAKSNQGKPPP